MRNERIHQRRQGMAAVLAMLFLVLFSTLALGFYAAVGTSVQIAGNQKNVNSAMLAADSGMNFIRYQLALITIPPSVTDYTSTAVMTNTYNDLVYQMSGTPNMGSKTISLSTDQKTIMVPANAGTGNNYIYLTNSTTGPKFYAIIDHTGDQVSVKVVGSCDGAVSLRGIQMKYQRAQRASQVFTYGVVSKGKVETSGSATITTAPGTPAAMGSVLSMSNVAQPVTIGGKLVSGDISITSATGTVETTGASIGGTTNQTDIQLYHVHKGVTAPELPTVDTGIFVPYATTTYAPAMGTNNTTLTNMTIPAGTSVKFTGNTVINGVLYVIPPANVEFAGNAQINGMIVVKTPPDATSAASAPYVFNASTNLLNFTGSVNHNTINSLPAATQNTIDPTGTLRQLKAAILAPGFKVGFGGNFGTINGSILAGQVTMDGSAEGIVQGSVINLEDEVLSLKGSSDIFIQSTGTTQIPSAVYFSSNYVAVPATYQEVLP